MDFFCYTFATTEEQFKHNVVRFVSFFPNFPDQDATVAGTVGIRGEQLGFPKNPQAYVHSGDNAYLGAAVLVE